MKRNPLAGLRRSDRKAAVGFSEAGRRRYPEGPHPDGVRFPESRSTGSGRHVLFGLETQIPGAAFQVASRENPATKSASNCILIGDDDALVRGSLAAVLELEGYVVIEARDGIETVKRAIERVPALVLLDLNMPHWDGWTAFGQIDRVAGLVPVIVITARPNQYEKAVRLGVDAFMEKPLEIPVLVRAIKRLTGEPEQDHLRRITDAAFVTENLGREAAGGQ